MRSKILFYLPEFITQNKNYKNPYKLIKELGFDQLVVDANIFFGQENFITQITKENLEIFALHLHQNFDSLQEPKLLEFLHNQDVSYLLIDKDEKHFHLTKLKDSGVKILIKSGSEYCHLGETLIVENPINISTKPLTSKVSQELSSDRNRMEKWVERSLYFLLNPEISADSPTYFMHCKDMLNRLYFLGVR